MVRKKEKTIAVLHLGDTLNYGTMMMGEVVIYHLNRLAKDLQVNLKFRVPTVKEKVEETRTRLLGALKEKVRSDVIEVWEEPSLIKRKWEAIYNLVLSNLRSDHIRNFLSWVEDIDLVLVLGGDIYTESYGYKVPLFYLGLFRALEKKGIPVVMLGQTIGPFFSWRVPLVKRFLQGLSLIVAREPLTYSYLKNRLGIFNIQLGADLAFAELAREQDGLQHPFSFGEYFCIVPSEIVWRYALEPRRELYLNTLVNVSETLLRLRPQANLVLLPHVLSPRVSDDREAARDLYKLLVDGEPSFARRVLLLSEELLPFQARAILGNALLVFTGRMHAAVSALVKGAPAISLAYSEKYAGIIGEYLGFPEWIVDVRQNPWTLIESKVIKTAERLLQLRETDREKIRERALDMRQRAMESLRLIAERFLAF